MQTSTAKTILNALHEGKERSTSTKSSLVKSNPVTVTDTRSTLQDVTSKVHQLCLVNRYSIDHPVVGAKVSLLLNEKFANMPRAMLGIYARRVTGELRSKLLRYR